MKKISLDLSSGPILPLEYGGGGTKIVSWFIFFFIRFFCVKMGPKVEVLRRK